MNKAKFILGTASVVLAMAFIFSCSSDDGGGGGDNNNQGGTTYSYCIYSDARICSSGSFTECQNGGIPSNDCPFPSGNQGGEIPSSSSVVVVVPSSSSINNNSTPRCGNVEYNPSTQFCHNNTVTVYAKCGGNEYDPSTYFCSGNTIVAKCGSLLLQEYNPSTQFCSGSAVYTKCGGNEYNPSTYFCSGNTVYSKCGSILGQEYNPSTQECTDGVIVSNFTDTRDSKKYKIVDIGTQTWMAENLNYTPTSGNSKCPNNTATNCTTYGRQYDWATAMDLVSSYNTTLYTATVTKHKGVCPTGWHLPSDTEWNTLISYAGNASSGTKLKAKNGWNNNGNGTNTYGFSALPGGYVEYGTIYDSYLDIGDRGLWWTATQYNANYAYNRSMVKDGSEASKYGIANYDYSWTKRDMLSVRCLKD